MEQFSNSTVLEKQSPVYKDQLLTVYDLLQFKQQLLAEIREILAQQQPRKTDKQWLKSFEIKKMLRLSAGKLQYLRDKGVIPYKKLGNVTYYDQEKIQELMDNEGFKQKLNLA